jgi:hypothetical protein
VLALRSAGQQDSRREESLRNGNMLIRTQQLYLLYKNRAFELPLKSSGNDFFRDLLLHFRSYTDEQGREMPSYVRRYLFSTAPVRNSKGSWFGLTFADLGWVTGAEYDRARQLSETLDANLKQRRKALQEADKQQDPPQPSPLPFPPA